MLTSGFGFYRQQQRQHRDSPPYLTAEPVERYDLPARELARHLEEHGVHERHFTVNGGAAEGVLGLQWQPDVFDHVGQELKIVQMAQTVHGVVQSAEI